MPPRAAGQLAEAIAGAVTGVAGVARLSGGRVGEIATYAPGRKVSGVRLTGDDIEVHLVAEWVASLPQLAEAVRTALSPLSAGRSVSVFVDDITQFEIAAGAGPEDGVAAERPAAPGANGTEADGGRLAWAKTVI
jgi:hypothetical protein